ncbi:hypothetical protein [Pararhizobium sp.]|uniref:hypothetical protein n=1 Tax=Pararhizobium sp. TaxID=1977563 RepID=UPI003D0B496B
MTIHLIGNSHVVFLRQFILAMEEMPLPLPIVFYAANNSDYKHGTFTFDHNRLRHSNGDVAAGWARSSGKREVTISPNDVVLVLGFDDYDERYHFLSADLGFISEACLADVHADQLHRLPSYHLVKSLHSGGCRARAAVVDPPLITLKLQRAKLAGRLVNEKRFRDLIEFQKARFAELGALSIGQAEETLARDDASIWSEKETMHQDGFHLGPGGVSAVMSSIGAFMSQDAEQIADPLIS